MGFVERFAKQMLKTPGWGKWDPRMGDACVPLAPTHDIYNIMTITQITCRLPYVLSTNTCYVTQDMLCLFPLSNENFKHKMSMT